MGLDSNYSVSAAEKDYVKNTLETEWVKALFQKEASWLQSKIINNFHSTNYSRFEQQKVLDKSEMKETIYKDPDMKAKYEAALAKHGKDGGFSEGILLLQTLAIKCITVLKNDEVVEDKLKQRSELGRRSDAMDGIIGPNTFYVLASIAKDQGIAFNGVIDQKLIDKIVDICLEDEPIHEEVDEDIPEEILENIQEEIPEAIVKEVTEQNEGIPQGGKEIIPEPIINETPEETQDIKPNIQPDIQEITIPANNLPLSSESDPQLSSESNLLTSSESNLPLSPYFKDNLQQDLDIDTKITNIDTLINKYPDIKELIISMKKIGIDYQQAKTSKNETDINRVIAILNEIENGNIAEMQKIVDMTREMNLTEEQAVKFIIFYKAFERKEIINPDLTSIDTLRASYGYNKTKNLYEKAEYEENLLELYTTKTDEKDKRIIMKEYTRMILEDMFTENHEIRTNKTWEIGRMNTIRVGTFYNQETNEFIVNYITPDKLPRKDEFQTVIFSKEEFLSEPEIVEALKTTLVEFTETKTMEEELDKVFVWTKSTLIMLSAKEWYNYNNFTFQEERTPSTISKKIFYDGEIIAEIGIGIDKNEANYFGRYTLWGKEKTERSKDIITEIKLLSLIDKKMNELYPKFSGWTKKQNNKNNLT